MTEISYHEFYQRDANAFSFLAAGVPCCYEPYLASFIVLQGLFGLFITKYGDILHFFFVEVYISQEILNFHIYDIHIHQHDGVVFIVKLYGLLNKSQVLLSGIEARIFTQQVMILLPHRTMNPC